MRRVISWLWRGASSVLSQSGCQLSPTLILSVLSQNRLNSLSALPLALLDLISALSLALLHLASAPCFDPHTIMAAASTADSAPLAGAVLLPLPPVVVAMIAIEWRASVLAARLHGFVAVDRAGVLYWPSSACT
jgi:hypothetical protein